MAGEYERGWRIALREIDRQVVQAERDAHDNPRMRTFAGTRDAWIKAQQAVAREVAKHQQHDDQRNPFD